MSLTASQQWVTILKNKDFFVSFKMLPRFPSDCKITIICDRNICSHVCSPDQVPMICLNYEGSMQSFITHRLRGSVQPRSQMHPCLKHIEYYSTAWKSCKAKRPETISFIEYTLIIDLRWTILACCSQIYRSFFVMPGKLFSHWFIPILKTTLI